MRNYFWIISNTYELICNLSWQNYSSFSKEILGTLLYTHVHNYYYYIICPLACENFFANFQTFFKLSKERNMPRRLCREFTHTAHFFWKIANFTEKKKSLKKFTYWRHFFVYFTWCLNWSEILPLPTWLYMGWDRQNTC